MGRRRLTPLTPLFGALAALAVSCAAPESKNTLVFAPSAEELERARRVVEAYERGVAQGRGVVALDGEMIDLPVVERARQVLADAKRSVFYAN